MNVKGEGIADFPESFVPRIGFPENSLPESALPEQNPDRKGVL